MKRTGKLIPGILVCILIAAMALVPACGGDDSESPTTASSQTIQSEQTAEAIGTTGNTESQPSTSSGGGKITWNDVPVYPGAKELQQANWSVPPAENEEYTTIEQRFYETKDSIDDVAAFYNSAMTDNGWEETFSMNSAEGGMNYYAKNNENDVTMVIFGQEDGKCGIAIMRATR